MTDLHGAVRAVGRVTRRLYAVLLVLVLLYVLYLAVSYLAVMVLYPAPVPQRLLAWPSQLKGQILRAQSAPGATAPSTAIALANYHQAEVRLQADRFNGCTLSGCHDALPHSRSVYVRSFANLHATFLTCQMCHEAVAERPVKACWLSIETGQPTDPPALVQLRRLLQVQRQQIEQDPAALAPTILSLLAQVIGISGNPALRYLDLEISTSEPGSPVWRDALIRLDEQLSLHTCGQYGAKIASVTVARNYVQEYDRFRQAAGPVLAAASQSAERKRLSDELHTGVLPKPDRCLACHGDTPPLVDFEALGYSPQRATYLRTNPIASEVQTIREGRQFYLPSITEERR
jgi:hypothetical protein